MNTNKTISYHKTLSKEILLELQSLVSKGFDKQINYKLDPGLNQGITCHSNGILTGFMTTDFFNGDDLESAIVISSPEDWKPMLKVLIAHAKNITANRILFICDPEDQLTKNILESLDLTPIFSEYRMKLDEKSFVPTKSNNVSIKKAMEKDTFFISQIDSNAFGVELEKVSSEDLRDTLIILQNKKPIGKLRILKTDTSYGIYGVAVEPSLQGSGIGTQALSLVLLSLIEQEAREIYLEVDSENPSAFHLYQNLGFKITSKFDYYPYLYNK